MTLRRLDALFAVAVALTLASAVGECRAADAEHRNSRVLIYIEQKAKQGFIPEAAFRCPQSECRYDFCLSVGRETLAYDVRIHAAPGYVEVAFFSMFPVYSWHSSMRSSGSVSVVLKGGAGTRDTPLFWHSADPDVDHNGIDRLIDSGGPLVANLRVTVIEKPDN